MTARRPRSSLGFALFVACALHASCAASVDDAPTAPGEDELRVTKPDAGSSTLLPLGRVETAVSWTVNPETGEDVLRGHVSFSPVAKRTPRCAKLRMMQVARVETAPGVDYRWPASEAPRNAVQTKVDRARSIVAGYYVDHQASSCRKGKPCSPYFRDSWPNADESQDGRFDGVRGRAASLVDYPFGWTEFERISLEACAVCADDERFLGCVSWGGAWPSVGPRTITPARAAAAPSATFRDALQRFYAYYAQPPR